MHYRHNDSTRENGHHHCTKFETSQKNQPPHTGCAATSQFNQSKNNRYQQTWHTIEFSNNRHTRHHHNISAVDRSGATFQTYPIRTPEANRLVPIRCPFPTSPPTTLPEPDDAKSPNFIGRMWGFVAPRRWQLGLHYAPFTHTANQTTHTPAPPAPKPPQKPENPGIPCPATSSATITADASRRKSPGEPVATTRQRP